MWHGYVTKLQISGRPKLGHLLAGSTTLAPGQAYVGPRCMFSPYNPLFRLLSKGSAVEPSLEAALGLLEA